MKGKELSPKRLAFVNEYLQCWNASEAARRAGYSAKTAYAAGSFLLRIPEVLREIEQRQRDSGMSANEALARLTDQARGSMGAFLHISARGEVQVDLASREARDKLHLIKKIRLKRRRQLRAGKEWELESIEIELYDAQAALIQIGRHHGLFTERAGPAPLLNVLGFKEALEKVYGKRRNQKS